MIQVIANHYECGPLVWVLTRFQAWKLLWECFDAGEAWDIVGSIMRGEAFEVDCALGSVSMTLLVGPAPAAALPAAA